MILKKIFSSIFKNEIETYLEGGAHIPTRGHKWDAGLDLYSREYQIVEARSSAVFNTGVHIRIPKGYVGFLKSKSGLNVNHGIISDGVIDCGYEGSIVVKLYNLSDYPHEVREGDKISQLVILPCIFPKPVLATLKAFFKGSERGSSGFGSTGR